MKNYQKWMPVKTWVNNQNARRHYKEGQVYWVMIGENVGFEQDGKGELFARPVLVVKGFSNELFLGVPLTSKNKSGRYYESFTLEDKLSIAILSQIRAFDTSRISGKAIGSIEKEDLSRIKNRLISLLK